MLDSEKSFVLEGISFFIGLVVAVLSVVQARVHIVTAVMGS